MLMQNCNFRFVLHDHLEMTYELKDGNICMNGLPLSEEKLVFVVNLLNASNELVKMEKKTSFTTAKRTIEKVQDIHGFADYGIIEVKRLNEEMNKCPTVSSITMMRKNEETYKVQMKKKTSFEPFEVAVADSERMIVEFLESIWKGESQWSRQ